MSALIAQYLTTVHLTPSIITYNIRQRSLFATVLATHCRASSVLNKNKMYAANNALDITNESTCWNSDGQADGNAEHSFIVTFHRNVSVSSISLQFQGGFVAEECDFYISTTKTVDNKIEWKEIGDAYIEPEDVNTIQKFDLEECEECNDGVLDCDAIKLVFKASTDFYGRVILYKLEVHGENK